MTDFPVPRRPRSSACSAGAWTRRLVAVSALLASTGAFGNGLTPSDEQRRNLACGAEEDRHPAMADVAEAQGELIRQILEQPRNLSDLQDVVDLLAAQIDNATPDHPLDVDRLRSVRSAYLALRPAGALTDRPPIRAPRGGPNAPAYPSADRPGSVCARTCNSDPHAAPYSLTSGTQKDAVDLLSPPKGYGASLGAGEPFGDGGVALPTQIADWRSCRQRVRIEREADADPSTEPIPVHAPRRNWPLVRKEGLLSFPTTHLPACSSTPAEPLSREWSIERCTGDCPVGASDAQWKPRTQAFQFGIGKDGLCWIQLRPEFARVEGLGLPAEYRITRRHPQSPLQIHVRVVRHCPECTDARPPDRGCAAPAHVPSGGRAPTPSTPQPRSDACPATSPNPPDASKPE